MLTFIFTGFGELTVEDARAACISFGDWSVKKEGSGSLICTKGSTSGGSQCNSIDTWRVVVWEDGYGTPYDSNYASAQYSTHAGYYYGGLNPCAYGDNLGEGYPWADTATTTTAIATTTPNGGKLHAIE